MGKKILLVDDEVDLVEMVKLRLEANDYQVVTAYDGQEGLDKAKQEKPDLIILDLMMPKIDGYKVCRMLKFDDKYKHIPVLMFTARAQEQDEKMGEEVGADAYMTKPFDPADLQARVEQMLIAADKDIDINPLTNLPGKNHLIDFIKREKQPIFKIQIEGMKIFNKKLGFRKGNEVIKLLGRLTQEKKQEGRTFHLMNDVFITTTKNKNFRKEISRAFKDMLPFM